MPVTTLAPGMSTKVVGAPFCRLSYHIRAHDPLKFLYIAAINHHYHLYSILLQPTISRMNQSHLVLLTAAPTYDELQSMSAFREFHHFATKHNSITLVRGCKLLFAIHVNNLQIPSLRGTNSSDDCHYATHKLPVKLRCHHSAFVCPFAHRCHESSI